jgi:hypothetical protein
MSNAGETGKQWAAQKSPWRKYNSDDSSARQNRVLA